MTGSDDLEQGLRSHLRRRAPSPPAGFLHDVLRQTAATPQSRRGLAFGALGWWGAGAAAAIVLALAAVMLGNGLPGGSDPRATQTAAPSVTPPTPHASATTISIDPPSRDPDVLQKASDIFGDRLLALGIIDVGTYFSTEPGDQMTFTIVIPPEVDPADVEPVLRSRGEITWLALPQGVPWPSEGDPVPAGALPLFGGGNVVSARVTSGHSEPPTPEVEITLDAEAAEALADYTSAHVGEPMPLAMDGLILMAPTIQAPIDGGVLIISLPAQDESPISAAALAAILSSGPLPVQWTAD